MTRERLQSRPLWTVIVLEILFDALAVLGAVVLSALFPGLPRYSVRGPSQSLVLVLVSAVLLLISARGPPLVAADCVHATPLEHLRWSLVDEGCRPPCSHSLPSLTSRRGAGIGAASRTPLGRRPIQAIPLRSYLDSVFLPLLPATSGSSRLLPLARYSDTSRPYRRTP